MDDRQFKPASDGLRVVDPSRLDLREESEIVAEILSERPVTHTKNIWTFWDKGWDALQPWKKRNIVSWARRLGPSWQIRVIDSVAGSPRHVSNYVPQHLLPAAVRESRMKGKFSGQHTADHARNALMITHGGVWLDVSFLLLRHLDDICWDAICDTKNPHDLCLVRTVAGLPNSILLNGFIAALPGNPFLEAWHTIFQEVWKDRDTCTGLSETPLFDHITKFELSPIWQALLGQHTTTEFLNEYFGAAVSSSRLCSIQDPTTGFSGAEYFRKHCRLFDLAEMYPMHSFCIGPEGFDENEHMQLLSLPRAEPVDREDAEQVRAERLVEGALATGIVKSFSQGPWDPSIPNLAAKWSKEIDADARHGTWAGYLRWGAVHLEQTRELEPLPEGEIEKTAAQGGTPRKIWSAGLLEPIKPGQTPVAES